MNDSLSGKIAVITGAAGGIGRATAVKFAEEGVQALVLVDLSESALLEVAADIEKFGCSTTLLVADLSTKGAYADLVTSATNAYGRIDALIHTAAAPASPAKFADVPDDVWASEIAMNLNAPFYLGRGFSESMSRNGGGTILYTGSIASLGASRGMPGYVATKTGLLGLVRAMAVELGTDGVRVNLVSPGAVDTPRYRSRITDDDQMRELRDHFPPAPLDRMASPLDIADAFSFLASDNASYITGHNLVVDGGTSARVRTPND